jgi:hypothetical protein
MLAVCGTSLLFAQESSPKILFLHLKLESNQVSLVTTSVASGTLKKFSGQGPSLELEVVTSAGQVLWSNTVANPSIRHLEFEDPDHPGEISSKEVQVTNAEFTVRVPVFQNAHHVNFYQSHASAGTTAQAANPSVASLPLTRRTILGTVTLPPEVK